MFLNCNFPPQLSFQFAFRIAQSGKKVLYFAAKAPESLPIDDEYDDAFYRDILKNIVFNYSQNASMLIRFLQDLRKYQPKPDVMIVDFLHTFFDDTSTLDTDGRLHEHFIECHMLITASLQSAVDNLALGRTSKFISVVCIDPQHHYIYKRFIQKYIDLYYYKEGTILSFNELMDKIPPQ